MCVIRPDVLTERLAPIWSILGQEIKNSVGLGEFLSYSLYHTRSVGEKRKEKKWNEWIGGLLGLGLAYIPSEMKFLPPSKYTHTLSLKGRMKTPPWKEGVDSSKSNKGGHSPRTRLSPRGDRDRKLSRRNASVQQGGGGGGGGGKVSLSALWSDPASLSLCLSLLTLIYLIVPSYLSI